MADETIAQLREQIEWLEDVVAWLIEPKISTIRGKRYFIADSSAMAILGSAELPEEIGALLDECKARARPAKGTEADGNLVEKPKSSRTTQCHRRFHSDANERVGAISGRCGAPALEYSLFCEEHQRETVFIVDCRRQNAAGEYCGAPTASGSLYCEEHQRCR